jgi:EmrB/QacA subfamily drug resistance transporter
MGKRGGLAHRWRVLIVVSAAVFMASLDLFIVNIAFPAIERDFGGTSLGSLSWILNAYAIVFAALLVPAGRTADRLGRKRSFIAGLTLFTVASALCAAAPSVELLVAARVVQAVGAASLFPTSLALLLPEFPLSERRTAVSIWAAAGGVAAAAGPPVGGLLVQAGWQLVFLVNVPIGIVLLVFAARILSETREPAGTPRPDLLGAGLLTASIGTLTFAIVKAADWGWGNGRILALLAGAVVLLGAFWLRSTRHPAPVVEPALLERRSFALANLGALLFFMAFGAMLLSSVLFLTSVWGESVLRAGLQIAPGPAMAALFAVPAGLLAARVGERVTGALGGLLFAAGGVWWLTRIGPTPNYAGAFLPGMMIGGAGVGLVIPSLTSAATSSLPPDRFATGSAVLSMSRQIGVALGVAVLVSIVGTPAPGEALDRFKDGYSFITGLAVAAAVAMWAIGRIGPEPAVAAATAATPVPAEAAHSAPAPAAALARESA